jgi:hypothetical protein
LTGHDRREAIEGGLEGSESLPEIRLVGRGEHRPALAPSAPASEGDRRSVLRECIASSMSDQNAALGRSPVTRRSSSVALSGRMTE